MMSDRKRRKHESPAFCDATATVSAATFGARRLPEIKGLARALGGADGAGTIPRVSTEALRSGGGKTSGRHLRRRAVSHKPRKRHRYPDGSSNCPPPEEKTTKSRRRRRKNAAALQMEHETWRESPAASDQHRKIQWMTTHVWHAKRFHVADLWGWKVPLLHNNRGARAALRLAAEGKTLLQDATWCRQPICISASAESNTLVMVAQRVRRIVPSFTFESNKQPSVSEEGMMHEPDSFPRKAVGPVTWMWTNSPLGGVGIDRGTSKLFFYFWFHPSIREAAFSALQTVIDDLPTVDGPTFNSGGVACLKLRGLAAVQSLYDGLKSVANSWANLDDWKEELPPHGTMRLLPGEQNGSLGTVHVRYVRPRDPALRHNFAVCGVDAFCDPSAAKQLFVQLYQRGACPIGVAEEAHLMTECDPPLPVFPRDYPDTDEGIKYWNADCTEWNLIRHLWEGGVGRIKIPKTQPPFLSWTQLLEDPSDRPVVVRGTFGEPFLRALNSSAIFPTAASKHRRKRRSSECPRFLVPAKPLSEQEGSKHQEFCESLLRSLSLPALLLCRIQIAGRGNLTAGSRLYSSTEPKVLLGYATVGTFSAARGRPDGLGVLSAARFLEYVAAPAAVVVRRLDGCNELQLQVCVNGVDDYYDGTISLLL